MGGGRGGVCEEEAKRSGGGGGGGLPTALAGLGRGRERGQVRDG